MLKLKLGCKNLKIQNKKFTLIAPFVISIIILEIICWDGLGSVVEWCWKLDGLEPSSLQQQSFAFLEYKRKYKYKYKWSSLQHIWMERRWEISNCLIRVRFLIVTVWLMRNDWRLIRIRWWSDQMRLKHGDIEERM